MTEQQINEMSLQDCFEWLEEDSVWQAAHIGTGLCTGRRGLRQQRMVLNRLRELTGVQPVDLDQRIIEEAERNTREEVA